MTCVRRVKEREREREREGVLRVMYHDNTFYKKNNYADYYNVVTNNDLSFYLLQTDQEFFYYRFQ